MNLKERQKVFGQALKADSAFTPTTKFSKSYGFANTAKVIAKGIMLGGPNLQEFGPEIDGSVMAFVIRFLPDDEVYFAVEVRSDVAGLRARLEQMVTLGNASETTAIPGQKPVEYSKSNNNVKVFLARDGLLYLRNEGFWDSLDFDLSVVGPGIVIDRVLVALWPPATLTRRSSLAREFVGYLGKYIGREKIHELTPWPDELAVRPGMRRMPYAIPISEIRESIEKQGGHYPNGLIERYHAALCFNPLRHFTILSGLSGTGKTRLAVQYARAVHGIVDPEDPDPLFWLCAVRPDWTDPAGLTGYADVLSNRYIVPNFLEAVLAARSHQESPVFVVLDEMNLARIEYYLADVLSVMEVPGEKKLSLHSNDVPMEGSTGGEVERQVVLPPNLFITGTINVDESTTSVSDKVLDRAMVIDMSEVDLPGFVTGLGRRFPELAGSCTECGSVLQKAHDLLAPHGLGFGYRVAEEVIRYHAFSAQHLSAATQDVLDEMMVQKVLVKLRGSHKQRQMLADLVTFLGGMRRSQRFLQRLVNDLDEFGSFQASR